MGVLSAILGVLSLGFDVYPQFPSMCIILGIILLILIQTSEEIPAAKTYQWKTIIWETKEKKIPLWKTLLFFHAKIIFPTLFSIYLLLLIGQKVVVVPAQWRTEIGEIIEISQILWITLGSAVLANFLGLSEKTYEVEKNSRWGNIMTILLICLLSYGGMWAIFAEIAKIGRVAYFVSLSVGVLIALVSFLILTEKEEKTPSS